MPFRNSYRVHAFLRPGFEANPASSSSPASTSADKASKKRKLAQDYKSEPFKFVVGNTKTVFYVHKAILAAQSPALAALVTGPMQESQEGIGILPHVDAETFETFLHYVYTDELNLDASEGLAAARAGNDISDILCSLARVCVLSNYYGIPRLQATTASHLRKLLGALSRHFLPSASEQSRRNSTLMMTNIVRFCFDPVDKKPDVLKELVVDWLDDYSGELAVSEDLHVLLDESHELAAALCKELLKPSAS